ncbi:MAG: hydantoinase B/oxoprolinase family protein, partial [Candidatus Binatia bacterium]
GSPYSNRFEVGTPDEHAIEGSVKASLPAGAVIAYQYGGGAGFEDPLLRDPAAVLEDVLDEYVSVGAARERYGVVLVGDFEEYDLRIDEDATRKLRTELAGTRAQKGGPER